MSSSKRQKRTSSQDGQQTTQAQKIAKTEEDNRREREQREYKERVLKEQLSREQFNARPENQFIAERKKLRRVEGQCRRRLNEKEQEREKYRQELLNIRSEGSQKSIEQQEGENVSSPLDAQTLASCGGKVNLEEEPQSTERLMRQQIQDGGVVLDDKEYRQRVWEEKQRQTQLFSQQPSTQYILGERKSRKYKKYNEKRKAERASKKEPVPKVKSTGQVSSVRILCVDSNVKNFQTRSAAQKARRATELEKKAEIERMTASSDAVTVQKLDLDPKAHVCVQPETLYASLTEEEKYNIFLRRRQIKEQVVMGQQYGVSNGGNTPNKNKMVRFLYES
ncbi:hypothetical protein MKX03_004604 [Papaver bracteatum]|nr:hypothetical protein MKX03_004604 [Papaver bracteatum]